MFPENPGGVGVDSRCLIPRRIHINSIGICNQSYEGKRVAVVEDGKGTEASRMLLGYSCNRNKSIHGTKLLHNRTLNTYRLNSTGPEILITTSFLGLNNR